LGISPRGTQVQYLLWYGEMLGGCSWFQIFAEQFLKNRAIALENDFWKRHEHDWQALREEYPRLYPDIVFIKYSESPDGMGQTNLEVVERLMAISGLNFDEALVVTNTGIMHDMSALDAFKLNVIKNSYYGISRHPEFIRERLADVESQLLLKEMNAPALAITGPAMDHFASMRFVSLKVRKEIAQWLGWTEKFFEEAIPANDLIELLEFLELYGWVPAVDKERKPLKKKAGFTLDLLDALRFGELQLWVRDATKEFLYDPFQMPKVPFGASLRLEKAA
jgi:hypothetical protein